MKRLIRFGVAACVAAAMTLSPSPAAAQAPSLEVGQPFPLIMLPTLEDDFPHSILNYRGKKVVLHIFASW